jgi:hypothetical protein
MQRLQPSEPDNEESSMKQAFTIEKGVPIPSDGKQTQGFSAMLRAMEVGDSFVVPYDAPGMAKSAGVATNVASRAAQFARANPGFKFVTRTVDGGTRVWRVAAPDAALADKSTEMRKVLKDLINTVRLHSADVYPELWDIVEAAKKAIAA